MWFVYTPDDGDRQEWWFDPARMRSQDVESMEKRTGWDWGDFGRHLMQGSVLARRALLWMYQRRVHLALRFDDVQFGMHEVELEYSTEELQSIIDHVKETPPSELRDAQLEELEKQLPDSRPGPGKAPASTSG